MSAPITEAHRALAFELLQMDDRLSAFAHRTAARLIADSEARATAELRDSLALEQDIGNAACDELRGDADELRGDVVRLTAERDQLRAKAERFQRLQRFVDTAAAEMKVGLITFGGIAELRAERDQLRAELAAERARLDWVFGNCKVEADDFTTGNRDVYAIHDREDLRAAMKENAK